MFDFFAFSFCIISHFVIRERMEIKRGKFQLIEIERKRERLFELKAQREMRSCTLIDQKLVQSPKDIEEIVNQLLGARVDKPDPAPVELARFAPVIKQKELSMQTIETSTLELLPQVLESNQQSLSYSKEIQTDFPVAAEEPPVSPAAKSIIKPPKQKPKPIVELTETEKNTTLKTETFKLFFDHSSKIMERALNEQYDILTDYTIHKADTTQSTKISQTARFKNEKTKNRKVTSLEWSKQFPELCLASYNKDLGNINESDGLVLVWNLHLLDRPEFTLLSQSDVTKALFSDFEPSIVIGGTYSGQIHIWDTRVKQTPILSSSIATGHSHPVYEINQVLIFK
jgi:dynein intermediate chain